LRDTREAKVSIMMPAYNAAQYIHEAVTSLLRQSLSDWELIVVDDGSTDQTADIVSRLADSRIKLIRQENRGEGAARNRALSMAKGEYLGFLDADDTYLPTALEDLCRFLDENSHVGVVYSDGYFCDSHGQPLMRLSEHRPGPYTGNVLEMVVVSPSVISAIISTLIRRSIVVEHNITFDEDLTIGTDWDFWIQMARVAQFDYMPRLTCKYRVHSNNVTRTTGMLERRRQLIKGRLKIQQEPWFAELTAETRETFFRVLLAGLMNGLPEKQLELIESASFQGLAVASQASILRQVAVVSLVDGKRPVLARKCLSKAIALYPRDVKARLLCTMLKHWPSLIGPSVQVWAVFQRALRFFRDDNRYSRRPVPPDLAPTSE
jgi:glycosyltransferase involved in cell wall biosynthesis